MNNRATLSRPLCLLLAFALAASGAFAQTIPNPSFEANAVFTVSPGYVSGNTAISGWTTNDTFRVGLNPGTFGAPFADNGAIPNGARVAFIQSDGTTTTLATTITGLAVGTHYRVQFRANQRTGTAPAPSYRLNGGAAVRFTANPAVGGSNAYYTISGIFQATATTAALEISNTTAVDSTLLVDNFTIVAATNITVTNNLDSGAGSLRAALTTAAGTPAANVITFAAGLNGQTITLLSELAVSDTGGVAIDASALLGSININGGTGNNRIFNNAAGSICSLRGLVLTSGDLTGGQLGGAILNSGTMTVTQCTLAGNTTAGPGAGGGAIAGVANSDLSLDRCTITGNTAAFAGGILARGRVELNHCTVTANIGTGGTGGMVIETQTTRLVNTIVAGNDDQSAPGDDIGGGGATLVLDGANIIGVQPDFYPQPAGSPNANGDFVGTSGTPLNAQLFTLGGNGGATATHAIALNSPARNAAVSSTITTDQRGKPIVLTADIGAFEMQAGFFVLSAASYKTMEGNNATVTINRGTEASGQVTVRLVTANGSATSPADYTARVAGVTPDIIFNDGVTTQNVNINTVADFIVEGNHTFTTTLSIPVATAGASVGLPSSATVTIVDPIQVVNTNDSGTGSLRQAFITAAANSGPDAIHFASTLNGATITLGSEIVVNDAGGVTVDAGNLAAGLTVDGGPGTNRIFSVGTSVAHTLTLRRLTLTGGNGGGAILNGRGGAIHNDGGTLTLTQCTLSGNSVTNDSGGAISNGGTLTLTQCTLSGNSASDDGGAIFNYGTLTLTQCTLSGNSASNSGGAIKTNGDCTLTQCTVSGNSASNQGGGIFNHVTLTLNRSIVAGNTATGGGADIHNFGVFFLTGTVTRVGANLVQSLVNDGGTDSGPAAITDPPLLAALAANGGPTKTHALLPGSPAINTGDGSLLTTDQRGSALVGDPDIGAFEVQGGGVFVIDTTTNPAGYTPAEGSQAQVTVRRTGGFSGVATVLFTTSGGTATAGTDYLSATQTLTFNGNEDTKTVNIPTTGGDAAEAVESFNATLSAPSAGTSLGSPATASVFLIDPTATVTTAGGDLANPGVPTITNPVASPATSNVVVDGPITVTGSAMDNKGVALVQAILNGNFGAPITLTRTTPGGATTAFTGAVTPNAGTNTLVVRATDFAGRFTDSAVRTFKVLRPLLVNVSGVGSVTAGFSPSSFREVGQKITVTATPGIGAMFANWTILSGHTNAQLGILASALEKPTLTFTHREGLALRATFVTNPYPALAAAAGTDYTGLIHANPNATPGLPTGTLPGLGTEGHLKITLMSTGAFSGTIKMDGTTLTTLAGTFDHTGVARFGTARATSFNVVRTGKPSYTVALTIDLNTGRTKDTISGMVDATDFKRSVAVSASTVVADRAFYDGTTQIVPAAFLGTLNATQSYTVVLPSRGLVETGTVDVDGFGDQVVPNSNVVNGDRISFVAPAPTGLTAGQVYTMDAGQVRDSAGNIGDIEPAEFGNFTVLVDPENHQVQGLPLTPTDYPQGDGFALLTVDKAGAVILTSGKLADGTAVTGSFKLSEENKFPLFLQLYPSGTLTKGYLSGDVALNAANAESDMSAVNLAWLRPADSTQHYYPAGWPEIIRVGFMGARYASGFSPVSSVLRKANGAALNAPDLDNGNAVLSFFDGQLSAPLEKLVSVNTANAITKVPVSDTSFTLNAFTLASGAFTGSFVHESDEGVAAPMTTPFQGVLYQKGVNAGGYGYFLTRQVVLDFTGESGAVTLIGNP